MIKKRIVVLASGGGTDLQSIIDAWQNGEINGDIVGVISNNPGAYALERARLAGIKAVSVDYKSYGSVGEYNEELLRELKVLSPDLIVLAGYIKILPGEITREYTNRIINIHPALIPSFCGEGWYGIHVHEGVKASGVKLTGATVHFVDELADHGAIILQESVPVYYEDTPEEIQSRVLEIEHKMLPKAVALFCEDRLEVIGSRVKVK
ncbi:MAG: phosphoribosylglycinamide formyltransferase [Clostridiales bacterium]|nr:phosphoribosylglycinamide formyltransferase [Clostridiales bacterium]